MHRISLRTYVGQPNEVVSLSTDPDAGGQVSATLDGRPIPPNSQFQLSASPGSQSSLQVSLVGPLGASCVVGLSVVDGSSDGDFLLCQTHNPAPVHFYNIGVAAATAVARFGTTKGVKGAKGVAAPRAAKPRGKARRKGGSK